ncbi:MAG: hypothetical protein RKP46_16760 [Candidatus Accumulibacter sp.]|uniref:hypothetical protein n=1 Tax=Accumulibacter sp. TaxID=2053492 RepID=UPI002879DE92|nr:hypothetical protein [Accumulibacter sp.]MDS4015981.1 hypothetical protein [Accumulibacter sp.]
MINMLLVTFYALALSASVHAGGPWRASEANTRGWQLMTPEERIEHQARIRGFRTYEECQRYRLAHHEQMEERARQRGLELPRGKRDICEHLQADKPSG